MTVEERIRHALREEADAVEVDVARLHDATLRAVRPAPRARRPRVAVLVGAAFAVAAVVLAVVLGGTSVFDASRTPEPTRSDRPRVATSFTCPRQVTVDDAGRRRDDSFLPTLEPGRGPAGEASEDGAPRFAYDETRRTATLRLGNADGSLASVSRFRRTPDGWDLVTTTKCVGADGGVLTPATGTGRLGLHGSAPYPASALIEHPDQAVLVDDRSSYDVAGLVQHRSMWAAPCGRAGTAVCLASGTPTKYSTLTVRTGVRPEDVTDVFLDPDDSEGLPRSWGLWAVADPGRAVLGVRATTRDGRVVDAVRRRGPGWSGRLYLVLARKADVSGITVTTAEGTRTYPLSSIR